MNGDRLTELVLLATGAAWLLWEVVIIWQRAQGKRWKTISMVLQRRGWQWNIIPWGFGVLTGHWWWNQPNTEPIRGEPWIYIALGVITAAILARDVWKGRHVQPYLGDRIWRHPLVVLLAGVIAGHTLWPQRLAP